MLNVCLLLAYICYARVVNILCVNKARMDQSPLLLRTDCLLQRHESLSILQLTLLTYKTVNNILFSIKDGNDRPTGKLELGLH